MRVISSHVSTMQQQLAPGSVVFEPGELRPSIESTVREVLRKAYDRLPWIVRRLISFDKLERIVRVVLEREPLPGSTPVPSQHPGYNGIGLP